MKKKILGIFLGFFFLAVAIVGYFFYSTGVQYKPQADLPTPFSLDSPPTEALVGTIATLSGTVLWQSRTASSPSALPKPRDVVQGEELLTGDSGSLTISFPDVLTLRLFPKSHISLIQTLPATIVVRQAEGTGVYSGLSEKKPISVRGLDILLTFGNATCSVSVDTKTSRVSVIVTDGEIRAAYTDTDNISVIKTFTKGQSFIFTNDTKKVTVY